MTIELLTLIALWCGSPVNDTKGAMGFKTGAEVSVQEVNQCRDQLRSCIKTEIEKQGISEAQSTRTHAAEVCTSQIQHPGRD